MLPALKNHAKKILFIFILSVAGILIYRNSLHVPFIFDDMTQIVFNPTIQSLHWPWQFLVNNRRPLLYATLAFNFQHCGFNTLGFHVFNVSVHVLAAISLFLLINKTCRLPQMGESIRREAYLLAFGASLLWVCHPIQTQAVTYIIQRAESLMSLFFLLTLYFCVQYFTSRRIMWLVLSGLSALFCSLTKEVALALPFVVLLYDRAFISISFRQALRENRWLYLSLSFTLLIMFFLYFTTHPQEKQTAGFAIKDISALGYALNQPRVILHYLQLVFWPHPLIFDYAWPLERNFFVLLPSVYLIVTWIIVLTASFCRYPRISFLGLTFFIILAPSSSFIPLKDLIYEYRMYLPLSCLTIFFTCLLKSFIDRCINFKSRNAFFIVTIGIFSLILGGISYQRNKIYQSEERLWRDVLVKQPENVRIWNDLGSYLFKKGANKEAAECFLKSLSLNPRSAEVSSNLSMALASERKFDAALYYGQNSIKISPDFSVGYYNLGVIYMQMGRYEKAIDYFEKTLTLGLVKPTVLKSLAVALLNTGRGHEAVNLLNEALRLDPDSKEINSLLKFAIQKLKR